MSFVLNMKGIEDLQINFNPDGWGPTNGEKVHYAFEEVPYAHFDKKDKCNKPADFGLCFIYKSIE